MNPQFGIEKILLVRQWVHHVEGGNIDISTCEGVWIEFNSIIRQNEEAASTITALTDPVKGEGPSGSVPESVR